MYLYSGALGVVVGLKESRRHGAGLESPGIEDMHDPGYVLLRILLPRTRVNKTTAGTSDLVGSPHGIMGTTRKKGKEPH
jgi:hypothetical protein